MTRYLWPAAALAAVLAAPAMAHDTWVQPNTNLIRTGDAIHIALMLGNHGNDHRDFKLASKLAFDQIQTFEMIAPDGKKYDLKPDLTDMGYAPKEGFYSAKFVPAKAGLYVAAQSSDSVVNHGKPIRAGAQRQDLLRRQRFARQGAPRTSPASTGRSATSSNSCRMPTRCCRWVRVRPSR